MMEIKLLEMVVVIFVEFRNILLVEESHRFALHLAEMEYGTNMPLKNVIMVKKKIVMESLLRMDAFSRVLIKV